MGKLYERDHCARPSLLCLRNILYRYLGTCVELYRIAL
nr:MAG TPA: hypothetical protein [Caudoviricetes sp.]